MTYPSESEPTTPDGDTWQRFFASSGVLDQLAASVEHWAALTAEEATWLTHTALPDGWQTIPIAEGGPVPLRVAAVAADARARWTACQALSAFRFTGFPSPDLLYDNNDRALRAVAAS
jgi:hypothetical protein